MIKTRNKAIIPTFMHWFPLICLAVLSSQPYYGQGFLLGNENAFVAGGTPAPEGRFPYMCSLRKRGDREHVCGGMLVARKWLLTAAHCIDPANVRSTGRSPLIYCGIYRRKERDTTKTYGTTRCYLHHLWTGAVSDGNDIALCELDRSSNSAIPDLATAGDAFGRFDQFTVLGWGRTATNPQYAEELQMGNDLRFVPDTTCKRVEDWQDRIKNSMICAGFNDPNTCSGDSGGPLLIPDKDEGSLKSGDPSRDLIVGITSFGDPSCDELIPGVYTRVSCYRSWINCIIGGTGKDCTAIIPCEEPPFGCSGAAKSGRFNETSAIQTFEIALETDDAVTVERLICEGLNPNTSVGLFRETLLHLAALSDAVESARVLLRNGAAVDGSDSEAPYSFFLGPLGTPLHNAAGTGSVRVLELLIKNGANVNSKNSIFGRTPLIRTAYGGRVQAMKILIQNGADLEIRDTTRYTALHHAAASNVPETAKALIDAGANIENVISSQLFFNFGDPINFGFLYLTLDSTSMADEEDDGGWNSLHLTAKYNSSDVTKVLLDAGAKIESKTDRGSSALHIAAMNDAYDVAKVLIDRGANINAVNEVRWTPLHFAAQNSSLSVAKALEAAGAEKEARSTYGYDPLMIASYHGSLSVVEFLLDEYATSNSANDAGDTPLHLAASRGNIFVVETLLEHGASKLRTNNKGETPYDRICLDTPKIRCLLPSPSGFPYAFSFRSNFTLQSLLRVD